MFQTRPFCRCIILLGICWFVKSHIHGVPPVLDYLWFDQISAAFRCFNQQAVSRPAPPTSQALQGTGAAPLFFDYHCRFLMIIATYSMHYKHTCIPPFDNQKRWKSWHLLKTTVFFWYPSIWNRKSSSLKFFEHQNKFIQVEAASRGVHVEDWIITVQSESPWSHVWQVVYLTYGYTIIPYNTWWLMYIHTHYIHIQFIFIHIQLHWMLWWEDELLHPLPPVGCWILFEHNLCALTNVCEGTMWIQRCHLPMFRRTLPAEEEEEMPIAKTESRSWKAGCQWHLRNGDCFLSVGSCKYIMWLLKG